MSVVTEKCPIIGCCLEPGVGGQAGLGCNGLCLVVYKGCAWRPTLPRLGAGDSQAGPGSRELFRVQERGEEGGDQ